MIRGTGFRRTAGVAAAAVVVALLGLDWLLGRALREEIQASTEVANQTFARVFVNQKWDTIRPMLGIDGTPGEPRANPNLRDIDARVRSFARGTDLVKVKIYDPRGLTVYSSDPAQIGEDKSGNPGFLGAARGRTMSELTFRGRFGSFDGEIHQRNLVSSYVPVRSPSGVEAVVEIYTDRTASIESIQRRQRGLMLWLGAGALVLYAAFVAFAWVGGRRNGPEAPRQVGVPAGAAGAGESPRLAGIENRGLLASVAMELSGPLEALGGALDRASTSLPAERALADARDAAAELRKRADWIDLLADAHGPDSRTTSGGVDATGQVRAAIEAVAPRARLEGVDLQVYLGPGLGPPVVGGPVELAAILESLLSDAIDATDAGFVHLKVNASPEGVQFDVIDSGRPREAPRDGTVEDVQGVAGEPGLYGPEPTGAVRFRFLLADALVGRLGGRLRVSAAPGSGNWVTFTLPLAPAPEQPAAPVRAAG